MRRTSLLSTCLLIAANALFFSPSAQAQSDADRAAARELFFDGAKKQEAGHYQDALDRFQRAQAVFSAPTHLLHIAECEAALGRLVEAGEAYRQLVTTPIPDSAPAAFKNAKDQAQAELTQLEPRIPQLRIDVRPANAPGLVVEIDGVKTNVALVGVARPIDPGPRHIVVTANGFAPVDQTVTIRERESKTLAIALPPTSGVVYAPPPPVVRAEPPSAPPPPPPRVVEAPPQPPVVFREPNGPSSRGLLVGVRLGASIFTGNAPVAAGSDQKLTMPQLVSPGAALALDAGYRFARRLYLGATLEHDFLGAGSATGDTDLASNIEATPMQFASATSIKSSASGTMVGAQFGYITNPDGFGFTGLAGLGIRHVSRTDTAGDNSQLKSSYTGAELLLSAGLHFNVGDHVRIVPRVDIGIGSFSSRSVSCTPGNGQSAGLCPVGDSDTSNSGGNYASFFLGIGGYYNLDFASRPQ